MPLAIVPDPARLACVKHLPAMLRARDIADALAICTRTWCRWARAGKVHPGIRVGKRRRWPREVLEELLAGRSFQPEQ